MSTYGDPMIKQLNSGLLPTYMRGYRCKTCNEQPAVIVREPVIDHMEMRMIGSVAIKCKCFGTYIKVPETKMDSPSLPRYVQDTWDQYRLGIADLEELIGEPPEGRDRQTHSKMMKKFLGL